VYATLINVVAVMPVLFLGGLSGSFFRPLATAYALAVLASMAVALTVTPALALILLQGRPPKHRDPPLVRVLKRAYEAILIRIIRRPTLVYATVALALVGGAVVGPRLGQDLFPTFKEQDFLMHFVTPPGSSINEERRIVTRFGLELQSIPGVRSFGSHIGQAFAGEEIAGPNFAENWVSIDPKSNYDQTVARIKDVEEGYPGLYRDVQTYLRERVDEVVAGASEPLVVRVYGSDLHVLRGQAARIMNAIKGIDGLADLHQDFSEDVPQVVVRVKLDVASRYGLKPGDIRRAAATLLASEEVGDVFRAGKAYDTHVWSTAQTRRDYQSIRNLPIDAPRGGRVPLGQIADVTIQPTPSDIKRENGSRRIDVAANLDSSANLGSVTNQVRQRLARLRLPLGYHAELLGEAAERQAASQRLLLFAIWAVLAILLLLQAAFRVWRFAWMLMLTLPMALAGGVIAAYFGVGSISLGALIGFYTVLGIAVRNGIMMISHLQHLEREEGVEFGPELVLRGAKERLSPILMTALATGLAILPLALSGDRPGQEIEHPMAIVILGGLLTSTMLNLFVVPFLYLRFGAGGADRRLRAELPPIDRKTGESWPPRPPELGGSGGRLTTAPGRERPW
jgi:Cu/Ag efflux pump CusA